ncbi:MerR family transcriptional regulator [Trinickia caryophylli]|uniref:Transcriptional regulator, MerR family n=1 Tax=Trinickia caryophylli TaxID=28094 RepID=A0A1X7EHR7_TRICW|nr:MerR family transcriptional regulator [Trinickia caryophylli]PMS11020.1 MerR family DNA-binding transcriptional regulator [Trinickia caryophylli]TRX14476.1 MerR family transcriptional regulator [Trinickia caryophylli]WQE14315.1 MerR family transcriptional regulator [Trinickia caryophylli]SMF34050.1 transcriptional regulator, MerR family [Trinickia caryophylli]GLU32302.1 MerR family transcriptional regulator [Trinickia caryophylli]
MLLKVGELAKRSGLTVRTLHHYDAIGLLTPSARADNGYRLYDRHDIARLHRIQALRRFGLSLAEVGAYLAQPDTPLAPIVARQIAMLDRQIDQASRLRDRLVHLHGTLLDGGEPELTDWLATLELMTMYDKYFSEDELARLPMYRNAQTPPQEWTELVAQVRALMQSGVPAESEKARELAVRWMTLLVRDTNGDPRLLAKLNLMHEKEPSLQAHMGISTALRDYVLRAFSETKMRIYEKYLSPDEIRFMRENYGKGAMEWPRLMADVRDAIDAGITPASPEGRELARRWLALFQSYAGDDPKTQLKFRQALQSEPELMAGTWANEALLGFVREAMSPVIKSF